MLASGVSLLENAQPLVGLEGVGRWGGGRVKGVGEGAETPGSTRTHAQQHPTPLQGPGGLQMPDSLVQRLGPGGGSLLSGPGHSAVPSSPSAPPPRPPPPPPPTPP